MDPWLRVAGPRTPTGLQRTGARSADVSGSLAAAQLSLG